MLIVTRCVGETIVIGHNVELTALGVKGNLVRIDVKVPHDVAVHREESYECVQRAQAVEGK